MTGLEIGVRNKTFNPTRTARWICLIAALFAVIGFSGWIPAAQAEIVVATVLPDEEVVLTAEKLPLLRGRWDGLWAHADGSRGRLKLEIQQADENKVQGVLHYLDTTYSESESISIDLVPVLRDGGVFLKLDADRPESRFKLIKSGSGYRLSWTSYSNETRQPIENNLKKGLVNKSPAPVINDIAPVAINDPGSTLPANWHRSGAFMQIYVRGYKDSNGDGIGDLNGVTASLDYLKDLGVKGIWLMPILMSQDHDHGYAVSDYRRIEPAYGTMADFDALLKAAHERGIGVIMDYVMNHSSALNPIFANAVDGPTNPYRDWYIWSEEKPEGWNIYGKNPWMKTANGFYFAGFSATMPDWNLKNRAVVDYHLDSLRFWLNRGLDGFRFDAVGNLVENGPDQWESQKENYVLMREVRGLLDRYSQRYMVCEAPADPYGFSEACGSAFAFGNNKNLVKAGKGIAGAIEAAADYPAHAPNNIATMLSNHDSFAGRRLFDQVGGDIAKYRLAAATYLTQPGIPFVYYGEEIGMAGGRNLGVGGDQELRTPFSWSADAKTAGFTEGVPFRALSNNVEQFNVAAELKDPASVLSFYKTLLALRNGNPALANGSYEQVLAKGTTLSFQRIQGENRVLVVFNYGAEAAVIGVNKLPAARALDAIYPAGSESLTSDAAGVVSVQLPAQSFAVYRF